MKEEGQRRIGFGRQFPSKGAQYGKRKRKEERKRGVFALIDWFLFGAEYEIKGFAFGGKEVTALSRHSGIAKLVNLPKIKK